MQKPRANGPAMVLKKNIFKHVWIQNKFLKAWQTQEPGPVLGFYSQNTALEDGYGEGAGVCVCV